MKLYLAPMEGVTTGIFRKVQNELFGGVDRYYTPFFSPTCDHIFTPRELRELLPENNAGLPVIPQILCKNAEDFLWAANGLADMGYEEVNLNLGCPSATVTAKGKGSGLLRTPDALEQFLDVIFSVAPIRISVKTRIGFESVSEWENLLAMYNRYPIAELIVHPRTRKEMYRGRADWGQFSYAVEHSILPLCYNGDIVTASDCAAFRAAFPDTEVVMLGRGAAANPAAFREIRGGKSLEKEELLRFHEALYAAYTAELGPYNAMRKMKELWRYLFCKFARSDKLRKKAARTRDKGEFDECIAAVFRELTLLDTPEGLLLDE